MNQCPIKDVTVTVARVLCSTEFFLPLRRLLTEGRIGRSVGIQDTETVGCWHFAHSGEETLA